jgi:BirA family biotin operon repressor/biotin-[acetyl-CoA-carboxylase] ligase
MRALVGLPLAVGVVIAEALATFDVKARLKWPNDVLVEGNKLAGILIETASVPHDASWAVVGIGLNMALPASLAGQIDRPIANIPWLSELDQDRLMATFLNGLAEAMVQFEQLGLAAFVPRWHALHAYAGQAVAILDNGRVVQQGTAVGIDEVGRLLLDTATGRAAIMAGDVSLRLREG